MVKSYLKFEHSKTFGAICSASANTIWDQHIDGANTSERTSAGKAFVAANEDVLCWDIKKGELLSRWNAAGNRAQVSTICRSEADPDIFAIGYSDGRIRIWDLQTSTVIITFNGHRSAVTHLRFDRSGTRLASGSTDANIILWDLVGEVGLFKLIGHKNQVTSVNFLSSEYGRSDPEGNNGKSKYTVGDGVDDFLLTTSKDALIKIWDLSTQHCIETHVAQSSGECWTVGLSPDQNGCITAGNGGELKMWTIDNDALRNHSEQSIEGDRSVLKERGTIYRQGKDRTIAVKFHPVKDVIAIHGSEKSIELWRIRDEEEVRKSLNRKRKRKREKDKSIDQDNNEVEEDVPITIGDIFVPYVIIRTGGKVRSIDWAAVKSKQSFSILTCLSNNQLEVYEVRPSTKKPGNAEIPDYSRSFSVDMLGHRSDIRCLALSSDDRMLASAAHGSLKIWNIRTQSCLRTLDCGYALCMAFLPGDKIVVIGTREGTLEVFDIASSALLDTISAHDKDIWSLHVHPDGKSIVTGSADKSAKFWEMKVVQEEILGTTRKIPKLQLAHTRTLKTADDILSVRFSPDGRLLAASALDSTVKVFFVDSLKLFLTLYGHKLPVLSMDISYDSKLIVTSSADKNVRVWGLDFGDCHKAFFAHQDSILSVSFVPNNREGNGHHFFSASKDKVIKYYDADKFEQIQRLEGHQGEIWALAIAHSGEFVVSASHDKSIRIWEQSDEQIFLEEEREKELEELYETTLVTSLEQDGNDANGDPEEVVADASKQSAQTLMAGEKIAEALELGAEDLELMQAYGRSKEGNPKTAYPQRNPVFLANNNISASQYVYGVIHKVPTVSLQDALLVLSFSQLPTLMAFLALWSSEGRNVPLTCRILFFMIKTHQKQIVSSKAMKNVLEEVKDNLRMTLQKQRHELGFNLAGLRVTGRKLDDLGERDYVGSLSQDEDGRSNTRRGQKRGFVNVA